ncbi:MAG: queuosine precursor transporter [Candidatus Eremiobacteraeota bacterium]|nr:queuosine precursor transporter [Candidatus Eremiobacteraeota bacterium]MCW5871225.1 queuosine precursor transporter [Candidatus Eremiobacteraeota bacterium]
MGFRFLDLISSAFVAVLLISNIAALKVFVIGPFVFDGGALIFPLSYIFGDVLTEVYGYSVSRRVIWQGLFWLIVFNAIMSVCIALPGEADWETKVGQANFVKVLGLSPRLALAGWLGFFWGEFCNSYVLAKLKLATGGRYLPLRTIGSTIAGQLVDTGLFCAVAFGGLLSQTTLLNYIVTGYFYKVGLEALMTPVTLWTVAFLKAREGVDIFDRETNFNPFASR